MPQAAPYTCSKCGRDLKDKEGMRRHIAFAHGLLYQLTSLTRSQTKSIKMLCGQTSSRMFFSEFGLYSLCFH